jgi:hypothetical protein
VAGSLSLRERVRVAEDRPIVSFPHPVFFPSEREEQAKMNAG